MKVVLIAPPMMDYAWGRYGNELVPIGMDAARMSPPFNVYLLSAILKNHRLRYEVVIADMIATGNICIDKYASDLEEAILVGISVTTLSWPTAISIIVQLNERYPKIPIVLGGSHPTMFDRYILMNFPVDYILLGESDKALPALCDAIRSGDALIKVPNLAWTTYNGTFVRNTIEYAIEYEEICDLPLPDYGELPAGVYQSLSIESSRGCSSKCSFCSISHKECWRAIGARNFKNRVEKVAEKYKKQVIDCPEDSRKTPIHIIDNTFTTDAKRAIEIGKIMHDMPVKLTYNAHLKDLKSKAVIDALNPITGQFLVGAESGYREGLVNLKKGISLKNIETTATHLRDLGISAKADFSFMIGLPWETKEDVMKTVRYALDLYVKYGVHILLQWYCLLPGSHFWSVKRELGLIHESVYNDFGFNRNLNLFRSVVNLSVDDIYEISDFILQMQTISQLDNPGNRDISYTVPQAISENFPLFQKGVDEDRSQKNYKGLREKTHAEEKQKVPGKK